MLLLLLSPAWTGCRGESPRPPTGPPPPPPTITGLSISGNLTLTSIGETSQLTLTASFSDNTTKDVTAGAKWYTDNTTVVTVSAGGLLRVVGFGIATVGIASVPPNPGATQRVTATPSGTFVIGGVVREPGAGWLASTLVVDTLSGLSATTNSGGQFTLAALPRLPYLKVAKDGYEPIEVRVTESGVDLPIQRVIRLIAGETVTPTKLAPNGLSYTVGSTRCSPCLLIRVVVPRLGTLHVRVTSVLKLRLFAEGQVVTGGTDTELIADVPINAPREVVMYLGVAPASTGNGKTAFTFETSMR
ncbi:MAG TPA: hypothetical protein VNJ03_01470 [Vicinamibacterales bacterium]|nr:hypothetical protein [Vicinamibacterales bacterium]